MYELVKLKEQFQSILKNFQDPAQLADSEDQDGSKKRDREWRSEQDFWSDPEYKRRREQKFLLTQQKHSQASARRKVLKFHEQFGGAEDDQGEGPALLKQ